MQVRITQLDGSLPNLALMKLSHWHKAHGDTVHFHRSSDPSLTEPRYDRVYGSAIFKFSGAKLARFLASWPDAVVGGTGTGSTATVESILGCASYNGLDYSLYPDYAFSLGFTQRGCRLSCKFCVVPSKEGKARSENTIAEIWRGPGHPRKLHLLDNDFFGQPEDAWRARVSEIRDGGFKVCLNQGINVRHITPEAAAAIASMEYRDDQFQRRRVYTAWDNLKDEGVFFRGIDMLAAAGVPEKHVMAYMLVGYDKNETWDRVWHRFTRMTERGVLPYPMVFDCRATDPERYRGLKRLQRWVVTGLYRAVPFSDYDAGKKRARAAPGIGHNGGPALTLPDPASLL